MFEGKQLLPLSGSAHSSVGQVTWQSSGEASNLVRMRNQSLGQSAPSLTAGLVSVSTDAPFLCERILDCLLALPQQFFSFRVWLD